MKKSPDINIVQRDLLLNHSNLAQDSENPEQIYISKLHRMISEAIFTVDLSSRKIMYVNSAVESIFGFKDYECIGKTTEMLFTTKSDFNKYGKLLKTAIRDGKNILNSELTLRKKSGETFPAEVTSTFIKENGDISKVISIVKDLSDQAMAEDALKSKQEYLELLHNTINEAIFTVELPSRIIRHVNKAVENMFGYTPEACLGRNTEQF